MRISERSPTIAQEGIPVAPVRRTIRSLRLDLEAARAGKSWLLLPEGFRDQSSGLTYPLPSDTPELQTLAGIPIPLQKRDSGVTYLKRALHLWKQRQAHRQSAVNDIGRRTEKIKLAQAAFDARLKRLSASAVAAVEGVRKEAERAVANLNDLFALGREGIEAQMRAHLTGTLWQGEAISASAFRECFRMVTQAVKGLGLPSEQRDKAAEVVLEEVAASLRDTQEAVSLAPGAENAEIEH